MNANNISDHLFILIKSMSKAEKQYFKLNIVKRSSAEKTIYLTLFNAIESQKEYDKEKILKKIKVIKFDQFANVKHYLYELILTTLRNMYADNSIDLELSCMIQNVEILYNRALFNLCWKILEKAKKLAQRHEKFLSILDILAWEMKLLGKEKALDKTKKYIEKPGKEVNTVIEKWTNLREYKDLSIKLQYYYSIDASLQNEEVKKYVESVFNHPLLQKEEAPLSYYAKGDYYHLRSLYFHLRKNDAENAMIYTKKRLQLYESHPEMEKEDFENYINNMNNYIGWRILLRHHDEKFIYLEKLRTILYNKKLVSTQQLREKIFQSYYLNTLILYNASGEFEKGIPFIQEMENFIEEYHLNLPKFFQISIHFHIASLYFGISKFDKALSSLNKLIIYKEKEDNFIRKDIHCASRLLELIIHYELKNENLLEYKLLSAYRYLPKENMLYKTETIMLNFIKQLPKVQTAKELLSLFQRSEKKIATIIQEKDPEELNVLDYIDLHSWMVSKIESRSFSEIVKEKNQLIHK